MSLYYNNRSPEAKLYRKLYSTARWKCLRQEALRRDHGLCQICLRQGFTNGGNVVDHIEPHKGNPELFYKLDNLQTLCKVHHDSDKQSEESRGYGTGVDENGFPLDPKHPAWKGSF